MPPLRPGGRGGVRADGATRGPAGRAVPGFGCPAAGESGHVSGGRRVWRAIDLHNADPGACARRTAHKEPTAVVKLWIDSEGIVYAITTPEAKVSIPEAGDALLAVATEIARDGVR